MPEPDSDGASVMASADANCARRDRCCVENVQPAVRLTSVSVKVFELEALTLAVSESPARTGLLMANADLGNISKNPRWDTRPFLQLAMVPICSTVELPAPSMPAKDANADRSPDAHLMEGSVQLVEALVNGPPWATYPGVIDRKWLPVTTRDTPHGTPEVGHVISTEAL